VSDNRDSSERAVDAVTVVVADARTVEDEPVIDLERWERLAAAVLVEEGVVGELTLTFIDGAEMAALNEQYMGKSGPTDVLSFPMDDEPVAGVPTLLGDVVISPAVASTQFVDHAGTFDDEIALLVVHGILHVLGHDHVDRDETADMRARELELLAAHHWGAPVPSGFRQEQA
jgi:probable rRNA maturation factor